MCYTILELFQLEGVSAYPTANGIRHEDDELGGTWFDQDEVIRRLRETFGPVLFGKDDPLVEEARRAEAYFAQRGGRDNPVVASLWKKAKLAGPAHPFAFTNLRGERIEGLVRRYDVRFNYPDDVSPDTREEIGRFLRSFAVGEVEEQPCAEESEEERATWGPKVKT